VDDKIQKQQVSFDILRAIGRLLMKRQKRLRVTQEILDIGQKMGILT
jgi:hypothetical protein